MLSVALDFMLTPQHHSRESVTHRWCLPGRVLNVQLRPQASDFSKGDITNMNDEGGLCV